MDKLIHLLFSNLWIVIVLLWVFRGLVKSGTMPRQSRRPARADLVPRTTTKVSLTEPVPVEENDSIQLKGQKTPKRQPKGVPQNPVMAIKVDTKKGFVPSPMEGMMWSEVFGPPRSKQPYLRRKS